MFLMLCVILKKNCYIKLVSTNRDLLASRQAFDNSTNVPNMVGAINGKPAESGPDYSSRLQQLDYVVFLSVADREKWILVAACVLVSEKKEHLCIYRD